MKSPGRFAVITIALFAIITAQIARGATVGHKPLQGKTIEISLKNKRISSATTTMTVLASEMRMERQSQT